MNAKQKICAGCGTPRIIYKSHGRDKFCRACWSKYLKGEVEVKKNPKVTTISRTSPKREKAEHLYSVARKGYLEAHPMCEAKIPGCGLKATDIHHKRGRTGEYYLDTTNFLAVCRSCHTIIETQPKLAKEEDWSKSRLHENDEKD